jgi:hypothetical protein
MRGNYAWGLARRWIGIAGYTLVMLLLFHKNLTVPETRGIAILGFATAMSLAVGYELSMRGLGDWAFPVVLLLPAVIGGSYAFWQYLTRPVPPTGPLLMANEPTPQLSVCREHISDDDLVIALGTNRVIASGAGPFTPLQANDCPTVKLIRRGKGLAVEAFGYDNTNSLAYSIRDTRLDLLMTPGLRARRPDPHTFVLADSFNQEVVYVRYLNSGAVRIRGRFLCGANSQVVVRDEGIWVGGLRLRGVQVGQRMTRGRVCARMGPGGPAYGIQVRSG